GTRTPGWTSPDSIEIQFTAPFAYSGGHLCIDLDGASSPDSWWPIDAVEDAATGTVVLEGRACGPRAQVLGQTASVAAADLVVGRTAMCKLFGDLGSPTFLIVGVGILPSPFDLALVGA